MYMYVTSTGVEWGLFHSVLWKKPCGHFARLFLLVPCLVGHACPNHFQSSPSSLLHLSKVHIHVHVHVPIIIRIIIATRIYWLLCKATLFVLYMYVSCNCYCPKPLTETVCGESICHFHFMIIWKSVCIWGWSACATVSCVPVALPRTLRLWLYKKMLCKSSSASPLLLWGCSTCWPVAVLWLQSGCCWLGGSSETEWGSCCCRWWGRLRPLPGTWLESVRPWHWWLQSWGHLR